MDEKSRNHKISKGGLIGTIAGAALSTKTHKPDDSTMSKIGKTVLISGLGYLIGSWIEKKVKK